MPTPFKIDGGLSLTGAICFSSYRETCADRQGANATAHNAAKTAAVRAALSQLLRIPPAFRIIPAFLLPFTQ
jgi:hypothetical protein